MKLNIPEFSVSQFSRAIKSVVEDAFGYVKIKGEITGFKKASSGHLYFTLKDESSTLTAVCFKNSAMNLNFEIADGLQVCASGKITTFEGRSNYQIIVDKIEIAGIGAILEMLEKRKQKLSSEGLFDEIYKKKLPYFPKIIGIITSPTGSVIEDMKNRINARCPSTILLYGVTVQGENAVSEICAGIKYFNSLKQNRPDLLIIARGGGSFEDLLIFNDEELVRTAFKSDIAIISAIGHETDNCLLDLVADIRAPTPSAGAEIATIVLKDLKFQLVNLSQRLTNILDKFLTQNFDHLKNLQRFIVNPEIVLSRNQKIIDDNFQKIKFNINKIFDENFNHLKNLQRFIVSPEIILTKHQKNLQENYQKIYFIALNFIEEKNNKIKNFRISSQVILQKIDYNNKHFQNQFNLVFSKVESYIANQENALKNLQKSLRSNHYRNILQRGFVLVKNSQDQLIDLKTKISKDEIIKIEFFDGQISSKIIE